MDVKEIKELINIFEGSKLTYFKLVDHNCNVTFSKSNQTTEVKTKGILNYIDTSEIKAISENIKESLDEVAITKERIEIIKSPYVGTITLSDQVKQSLKEAIINKGDVLCSIEAMKLLNEIVSPVSGIVAEILVEDADLVEYDQPIMKIIPIEK